MCELLAAGADPNARDVTGHLPLMISALNEGNSEKKCRLLIEKRADVNAMCNSSGTVLQWARERISGKFVFFLKGLQQGEAVVYSRVLGSPYED